MVGMVTLGTVGQGFVLYAVEIYSVHKRLLNVHITFYSSIQYLGVQQCITVFSIIILYPYMLLHCRAYTVDTQSVHSIPFLFPFIMLKM